MPSPTRAAQAKRTRTLISSVILLASCGEGAPPPQGEPLECALEGAAEFASVCLLQRRDESLIVHTPNGGFRRVALAADKSVEALDGMEQPVTTRLSGGRIQFAIGKDRFRLSMDAPVD